MQEYIRIWASFTHRHASFTHISHIRAVAISTHANQRVCTLSLLLSVYPSLFCELDMLLHFFSLQAAPIGKPVPADWTVDNQYVFSDLHDFAIGENVVVRNGDRKVFGKVIEKRVVSSPAMCLAHAFERMV